MEECAANSPSNLASSATSLARRYSAPAEVSAEFFAGVEIRLANGVVLLGKFDGEFASHASTYAGTGTVRYTW